MTSTSKPAEEDEAGVSPPKKRTLWGIAGALLLVLGKFKSLAFVGFKFLKFTTSIWSMVLMMWAYSVRLGWPYSTGFVLLILVHELGHGYAARRLGLKVGAPVFIPFVGAFIALKDRPKSAFQNFVIGAGGPLAGSLGAFACVGFSFLLTGYWSTLFFALGYSALILNLFNLMPIGFLDGGRMVEPIRTVEWGVGIVVLSAVLYYGLESSEAAANPVALLVLFLGFIQLALKIRKGRQAGQLKPAQEVFEQSTADAALRAESLAVVAPPGLVSGAATATLVYFGLTSALIFFVHYLPLLYSEVGQ